MNDDFKAQLTALALDEVAPDERPAIEKALAESPEARDYADETLRFCTLLAQSIGEPASGAALTESQRSALAQQLLNPEITPQVVVAGPPRRRQRMIWTAGLGAAAAAVVLLATNHLWRERAPQIASADDARRAGGQEGERLSRKTEEFPVMDPRAARSMEDPGKNVEGFSFADAKEARSDLSREEKATADSLSGLGTRFGNGANAFFDDGSVREQLESATFGRGGGAVPAAAAAAPAEAQSSLAGVSRSAAPGETPLEESSETAPEGAGIAARSRGVARDYVDASQGTRLGEGSPVAPGAPPPSPPASGPVPAAEDTTLLLAATLRESEDAAGDTPVAGEPGAGSSPEARASLAVAQSAYDSLQAGQSIVSEELSKRRERADGFDALPRRPAVPALSTAEDYAEAPENPFLAVASAPLSTFSIDVDTASYANVRRFLNNGQRPPRAAVRLEEMINYFRYDYPQPAGEAPFSVTVDLAACPWQPAHRLARIGLQGKTVTREERPAANLVFLVDVSGSMDAPNKLPLVKQSLHLLTSRLKGSDHVAIVTYAGESGVALPSTSLEHKETVARAIDALNAGGSTNGASGLQLSYQQARQHLKPGGVNRVVLATDGDFNVGITSRADLESLITTEAKSGVFLSVLGYGMGNLKDATMEMLANKGNGHYAYIDSLSEARKVLVEQLEGTLTTIAKDVKLQIEFNPAHVRHYRLLGYENRLLAREDFNDDTKDAGEIGAGHTVTALYEIVPIDAPAIQPPVDPLKYQPAPAPLPPAADRPVDPALTRESMTVKLRYKAPEGAESKAIEMPVVDARGGFAEAPADFRFAAGVAMTAMLLKDSAYKGQANWNLVRELARSGKGPDPEGYRGEFLQLVEKAVGVAP